MQSTANGTATSLTTEYLQSNRFWVEIDNILEAVFIECSGLNATTETYAVKEGGLNSHVHLLPVRTTYSNLTLKHGLSSSLKFWDWYTKTLEGTVERHDITIVLYSSEKLNTPVRKWLISGAYPIKWTGPTFNAKTQEFAVETVELAYDFFKHTI